MKRAVAIPAGTTVMPHYLAARVGLAYGEALQALQDASNAGNASLRQLIYHHCEPDLAVASVESGEELPPDWRCPLCGGDAEEGFETDVAATLLRAIIFTATAADEASR